jgi:hypothetical protein
MGTMVQRHQQAGMQEAAQAQSAQQAGYESRAQLQAMQAQLYAMQAQQAKAAAAPSPASAPPATTPVAAPAPDISTQLQQLTALKTAGALTDAEFDAGKSKLLGTA